MKRSMKESFVKAFCVSYAVLFGAFSLLVQVPVTARAATIASESDGFLGKKWQWSSVDHNSESVSGKIGKTKTTLGLYATKSSDRLYTLVTSEAGGLDTVNTYYISTGKNTGFKMQNYEKVDFIVRDANLFKATADNVVSDSCGSVWMGYYNDSVEMQLYLS